MDILIAYTLNTICGAGDENDDPVDDDQDADHSVAVAGGDASPIRLLMRWAINDRRGVAHSFPG